MAPPEPTLVRVVRDWGRIGCLGFGGPPAHITMLRDLCVDRRRWLSGPEFEHAIAACNLLPGPASTQLAIFCAWRVRGLTGGLAGGLAFVLPGLVAIVALAALFLAGSPPDWVRGAGLGAGAAVAAVAVRAALDLAPSSRDAARSQVRWAVYAASGAVLAALAGPWLVLGLVACGLVEVVWSRGGWAGVPGLHLFAAGGLLGGTTGALAWVAFKVGALSYGGGFVIIPLMQADAVDRYGWMTSAEFLNAVALGQVTPGPVVHTVAAVGYAAAGIPGALLAAAFAFTPSFALVLCGARHFEALRGSDRVGAFLRGAGPAAIGGILGAAIPLAAAIGVGWQVPVLVASGLALLVLRRGVVETLLGAGVAGALLV